MYTSILSLFIFDFFFLQRLLNVDGRRVVIICYETSLEIFFLNFRINFFGHHFFKEASCYTYQSLMNIEKRRLVFYSILIEQCHKSALGA